MPKRSAFALALLVVAAGALYATSLANAPIYLHEAEVLFALHAHSIATTAHDTNGRFLPLYFQMPSIGSNVWFHPALVYFTVPFLKLFPISESVIRLPSVVVGVIDILLTFFIARRLFDGERWAFVAAILLTLTPAHFIHSRMAMDYLYPVPFMLAWLLCLLIFLERNQLSILFLATSFLGVGFYSYIASVIMMPVYLLLTGVALWTTARRPFRVYAIGAAGFLWPLSLLVLWVGLHPVVIAETLSRYRSAQPLEMSRAFGRIPLGDVLQELRRSVHFSGITGRISLYWYFFDPSYLFLTGGYANVVNSTRRVGVFLVPLLLFLPVGLVHIATRRRTPIDLILLLGFASAPLAACLVVPEPYAVDRELVLVPFAVLIATVGVQYLWTARQKRWRIAAMAMLAIVPLHFGFFLYDYFGDYRLRSAIWFEGNRRGAMEEILAREPQLHPPAIYLNSERIPYVDGYWRLYLLKHGRQDLLPRTVYFDSKALNLQTIPARSLVLTSVDDAAAQTLVASGGLRKLAMIPEPGDPPSFMILQR